jgi:ZIP family zinc transporter
VDPVEAFKGLSPILQALVATIFTWGMTAAGASAVFLFKTMNRKVLDFMLALAGGIMIAASFWSLLVPALEMAEDGPLPAYVPAGIGFILGGLSLLCVDKVLPHLHPGLATDKAEGIRTSWRRSILLVTAITIHNIPEGLAVGVAFGATVTGDASLAAAAVLALGIGLQNFPEGFAVSVPLRREGLSRSKAFWYGQLSGLVEPVAGVLGALAVIVARPILPYALAFAAGAMIFVVVEEVVPESQRGGNTDIATMGALAGFLIMMVMDVAFT